MCSLQTSIACSCSQCFFLMDLICSSSDWLASRTKFIHHNYITCIQNVGDRVEKKNAFLDPLHHSSEPQWILWRLIYLNLPSTHLYSIKPTKNLCFFPPPSNPLSTVIGPVPFLQRRERTSARARCVCVRVYVNETTKQLIRSCWLTDACASLSRSIAERWTVRDTDGSKPRKSKNRLFLGEFFYFTLTWRPPDVRAPTIWPLLWKRNHMNALRAWTCTITKEIVGVWATPESVQPLWLARSLWR